MPCSPRARCWWFPFLPGDGRLCVRFSSSEQRDEPLMPNKEVSLSIPSAPGMELAATAQAEALGEAMRLSRDKIDEVKFALVEACINAFEHAGQSAGRVDLRFRVSQRPGGAEMLEVTVADRGKGFDPASVEPPQL